MANTIKALETNVVSGLGTYTYTAEAAGLYTFQCRSSMLYPPSSLVITLKQNGTTIATSAAPSATQSNLTLLATVDCALNDVISIVFSSTAASDASLQAIKSIILLTPFMLN